MELRSKTFNLRNRTDYTRATHIVNLYIVVFLCVFTFGCLIAIIKHQSNCFLEFPEKNHLLSKLSIPEVSLHNKHNHTRLLQFITGPDTFINKKSATGKEEENSGKDVLESYLLFFITTFTAAAALQWLISHVTLYNIPVSIIWFMFGSLLDLAANSDMFTGGTSLLRTGIIFIGKMNAQIVYLIFLPILLYEACLNIDWHKFKKFMYSGITLAVFGVGFQVAVIGLLMQYTLGSSQTNQWSNAFLFASSMASTDPVAVTSVLNGLQAPGKLASMFEGEALINDGSSMLLFQFFKSLSRGDVESWQSIVQKFVLLFFVGPLWGCVCGLCVYIWIKRLRKFPDMQVLTLVSIAYAVYFIGEHYLHSSGPIAIVCYGLFYTGFGHVCLDHEAQLQHHHSVKALACLANSSVFVIAGVVATRMIDEAVTANDGESANLIWNIPVLYIYLLIARASMILLFLPVLKRTGYGVNWKEVVLLIWGGLRGAIVLAMGLMIEQDHYILSLMRYQAVLYIAGNTFLILLINGVTFELLFRYLNPYPPKPFRRVYLERIMKLIDFQYQEERLVLEDHWLFRGTGILEYANKAIPVLGWRKMNSRGKIDFKLPALSKAFTKLPDCSGWIPPKETVACSVRKTTFDNIGTTDQEKENLLFRAATIGNVQNLQSQDSPIYTTVVPTQSLNLTPKTHLIPEDDAADLRARRAAASVLGLRDTRGSKQTNFDAKYYLRLVEHVTDHSGELPDVKADNMTQFAIFNDNYNRDSPLHANQDEEHGTELRRFDTDKTIIFSEAYDKNISEYENNLYAKLRDALLNKTIKARNNKSSQSNFVQNSLREYSLVSDKLAQSPSYSKTFTSAHNQLRRSESLQQVTLSRKQDAASAKGSSDTHMKRFLNGSGSRLSRLSTKEPIHRASPIRNKDIHDSRLPTDSLNSSQTDVVRMTRLRKPEWHQRKKLSISLEGEDKFFSEDKPIRIRRNISEFQNTDEPISFNKHQRHTPKKNLFPSTSYLKPKRDTLIQDLEKNQISTESYTGKHKVSLLNQQINIPRTKTAPNFRSPVKMQSDCFDLTSKIPYRNISGWSIGSAEEFFEMPGDLPIQENSIYQPVSLVKVLRKEREGELYIMVFNAIRQMYKRLYEQQFIGGATMLSLTSVLDHVTDFALGRLKRNPITAWKEVLKDFNNGDSNDADHINIEIGMWELTGFEVEWRALASRLNIVRWYKYKSFWLKRILANYPGLRTVVTYHEAVSDLEQITAYVDVHEELLWKGGSSLEELLGSKLLMSFKRQVYEAKQLTVLIRKTYPDSFPYALAVHAATMLVNLKLLLIEEQHQKGLILEEDCATLNYLFNEQLQNLACYRPFRIPWKSLFLSVCYLSSKFQIQSTCVDEVKATTSTTNEETTCTEKI